MLDAGLANSRAAMDSFNFIDNGDDDVQMQIAMAESINNCPERIPSPVLPRIPQNPKHFPMKPVINWQKIFLTVKGRGKDSCPICIQHIGLPILLNDTPQKSLLLLNCSHVYHEACLNSFKQFGRDDCPVCRKIYESKRIG